MLIQATFTTLVDDLIPQRSSNPDKNSKRQIQCLMKTPEIFSKPTSTGLTTNLGFQPFSLTCVCILWLGKSVEALFNGSPLSWMAFFALCSFFFILQYSRFLLRKSSSNSPGIRFGGTIALRGTGSPGFVCAVI